jgi:curved DNA-binding protein
MNPKTCHYEILGVSENSSKDQIENAFNELSEKYENKNEKFLEISIAFRCLKNPQMKLEYDKKRQLESGRLKSNSK